MLNKTRLSTYATHQAIVQCAGMKRLPNSTCAGTWYSGRLATRSYGSFFVDVMCTLVDGWDLMFGITRGQKKCAYIENQNEKYCTQRL